MTWMRSVAAAVTVGSTRSVGISGDSTRILPSASIDRPLNGDDEETGYEKENKRYSEIENPLFKNSDEVPRVRRLGCDPRGWCGPGVGWPGWSEAS